MRHRLTLGLALAFASLSTTHATAPVRLDVSPRVSAGPIQALHLRVWVERDDQNRALRVDAESPAFFRSSGLSLEGAAAPRVHEIYWTTAIPCGLLAIRARTFDQRGRVRFQASDRAFICVVPE